MKDEANLHAGHRSRMTQKLLKSPELFSDYELIEVLLFSAIPRKNTNEIAHKLLQTFGTLERIFNATAQELISVDGIGDKAAAQMILFGQLIKRIKNSERSKQSLGTFESAKNFLIDYFRDERYEILLFVLLDKNRKIVTKIEYTDVRRTSVSADMPEIANAIALHKPMFAIMAHNHPGGSPVPSEDDDLTTKKVNVLCQMHGVNLLDHVIVAGERLYSYYQSKKLDDIKQITEINSVFGKIRS